ncbi:hypothetical protein [Bradyrhizobium ottawaense]|uniref:hypothetical protein n=1 Tax=Bradyrhizobium ottawaense TaxID=931866 RepID=UPI0030F48F85
MSNVVRMKPDGGPINELFVFISNDGKGNDGIGGPSNLPLMTSKRRIADRMVEHAREIARENGVNIRMLRFGSPDEVMFIAGKH